MKKVYSAPDIFFDSFALSQGIANVNNGCTRNITNHYSGSCGLYFGDKIVFIHAATGCRYKVKDGEFEFDNACYQIPGDDNRLFNS